MGNSKRKVADGKFRNSEYISAWDRIKNEVTGGTDQDLQNRADLNKAAEDARNEEARQAKALAEKRRREAGY